MSQARQRGFALLIVLATLGPLALLVSQFIAAGRTEVILSGHLRANAATQAAADGAVHEAILRRLQGRWLPDGSERRLRIAGTNIRIRFENEALLLNPNYTNVEAMRALLVQIGVEPTLAASIARAIIDWRSGSAESVSGGMKFDQYRAAGLSYVPTSQPFETIDEIALVVGMTPDILARIRPFVSVYSSSDGMVVRITATATNAEARSFRQSVVMLNGEAKSPQAAFRILTWSAAPR